MQHVAVSGISIGLHPMIKRLAKACFIKRPPMPQYGDIWDLDTLILHLEVSLPPFKLSDMDLSVRKAKLTFILTLSRFSIFLSQLMISWN